MHAGESEAIALAVAVGADLLLIDERRGRKIAARFGLKFIGLLGALTEAKHKRTIPAVKPVLDELIAKSGFWINDSLYRYVLGSTGEAE